MSVEIFGKICQFYSLLMHMSKHFNFSFSKSGLIFLHFCAYHVEHVGHVEAEVPEVSQNLSTTFQ